MDLQSMRRQDVPLHVEVAAVLRNQIRSGELSKGTKLPALRELTETLGVARMTIIQAMNTLEDEGLIERYSGRGTFVREVRPPDRETLKMQADISQIHGVVSQLKVDVQGNSSLSDICTIGGHEFRVMNRIHLKGDKPFCYVEVKLKKEIFDLAPERFVNEIAVAVLSDLGIAITSAKQKIRISYADFSLASNLGIDVNSAVFWVARDFYGENGELVYSALLKYPADLLELEIDFTLSAV